MTEGAARNLVGWVWRAITLAAALVPAVVFAGSLSVFPVRVEVAPGKQFCSLTIGNDGAEDVTVQVRGYRWRQQPDGTDILDDANSIQINPSIVTVPAGSKKLIRCSLPLPTGPHEDTFRLLVNELPRETAAPGTLQALLQLNIPVFRAQPDARPALNWSMTEAGGLLIVNDGARHARIIGLTVKGNLPAEEVRGHRGFYLLAGTSRTIDPGMPARAVTDIDITTEEGSVVTLGRRPAQGR